MNNNTFYPDVQRTMNVWIKHMIIHSFQSGPNDKHRLTATHMRAWFKGFSGIKTCFTQKCPVLTKVKFTESTQKFKIKSLKSHFLQLQPCETQSDVRLDLRFSCGTFAPTSPSCRCRRSPTSCRRLPGQTGCPRLHSSSGTRSCDVTWTPRWCSWRRPGKGGSPAAPPPAWRETRWCQASPTGTRSLWTTAPKWCWVKSQTWNVHRDT